MGQASWPKSSRKGIGVYTPTGRDFLGVGLDAALGYDVTQEHASRYAENALLGVELDLVGA